MTSQPREVMSLDAMRARADQLKATARESARAAFDADRQAAQLAWEADLIEAAQLARAEFDGTARQLARLKAAVRPLIDAERAAQDRLRAEEALLADRLAERAAAEAVGRTATEALEDIDIRVTRCQKQVRVRESDVAAAGQKRHAAEMARDACQAEVTALHAEWAEADRKARNPGAAPGAGALAPGVSGVGDLDDETRSLLAAAVLLMAHLPGAGQTAGVQGQLAGGVNWRSQLAGADPARPRAVTDGRSALIVPPARPA